MLGDSPKDTIGYLLQHVSFVLGRHSDQVLSEQLGIGIAQYKIMTILQWRSDIRQRDIAKMLGQTEASISRQIKLMQDSGLLEVRINPSNRREHQTMLTYKGSRLARTATEILNRYHRPAFEHMSARQQQVLHELLTSMHQAVCKDGDSCINGTI
jgi:MarR family transcriptional regulator, transcriptional regulator for hemolysin